MGQKYRIEFEENRSTVKLNAAAKTCLEERLELLRRLASYSALEQREECPRGKPSKLLVCEKKHPKFSTHRKQLNKNTTANVIQRDQGPSQDGSQACQCHPHCAGFKGMDDTREKAMDSSSKVSESC